MSGISEDMDVTTENRSVEVQGAGAQGLEGNGQSNSDDIIDCLIQTEQFEELLLRSAAFIDKTLFIKEFFRGSLHSYATKILITAPSQFGKSTIMNTLKVFCEPDVDEQGNIVTCLKRNEAGKWVEDKNKTPPKNYELFKTIVRNKPLQIYSCTCPTKHMSDDLENGTCHSRQFFYQHCGQYPVIYFSLKDISPENWNHFIETLKERLCETYEQHMYLGDDKRSHLSERDRAEFNLFRNGKKSQMKEGKEIISKLSEIDLLFSLKRLVKYLHIQFNKRVLIFIEEVDAPLMKLLHNSKNLELPYVTDIINSIGEMLGTVLKGNEMVLGALINACGLLATTISPYANNVSICPFLKIHKFSEYYGFTKPEVEDLLKMHSFEGFNEADILSYRNGCRVSGANLQLYNIFSVFKYLDDWKVVRQPEKRETDKNRSYFNNHGISSLNKLFAVEALRSKIIHIMTNESIVIRNPVSRMTPEHVLTLKEVILGSGEVDDEHADLFLQYMKDRGYFNIIEQIQNSDVYTIPNGEAKDEIMSQFYDTSYYKRKYNISNVMIDRYRRAINDLDRHNNESFQKFADSIAGLFSGDFKSTNHQDEIKNVLYTFCVNKFDISCARLCQENRNDRCDKKLLLIRKDGTGIIIDAKFGQNSARDGLKQIFDDEYYKVFDADNITKDKIYIGLHMNRQKVTVCAFATSNEEVVENFASISEEKLIVKSNEEVVENFTNIPDEKLIVKSNEEVENFASIPEEKLIVKSNEEVAENFTNIPDEKLIVKSNEEVENFASIPEEKLIVKSNEEVVENFTNIPDEKLIVKSNEEVENFASIPEEKLIVKSNEEVENFASIPEEKLIVKSSKLSEG